MGSWAVSRLHFAMARAGAGWRGGGGGRHSIIWPKRVCVAEQGMVFRVGYLIAVLHQKPLKECEDWQ